MKTFVTALNSGSNGNCYYVGNDNEAVIVDVGISCREIEKRLKRLELNVSKIKAIFISHEHSDHIRGLRVFSKKFNLPIYITPKTLANSKFSPDNPNIIILRPYQPIKIGDLEILAFPKFHDADDPHSFIIDNQGTRVGVLTDIGEACEHVIRHFKMCHAAFLEANYDEEMLEKGPYPYFLKNRIRSRGGHLSNDQAFELFVNHRSEHLTHLFLSHLSKDNNCPDKAKNLFLQNANGTEIIMTSRIEETPVYEIKANKKVISY